MNLRFGALELEGFGGLTGSRGFVAFGGFVGVLGGLGFVVLAGFGGL